MATHPDSLQPTGYDTPSGAGAMPVGGHSPQPQPGGYAPAAVGQRNVPGRVALALGVVLVIVSLLQLVVVRLYPVLSYETNLDVSVLTTISLAFTIVSGLIAIVAVTFGLIGLGGANRPRGSAAAGLAIGAWVLVHVAAGFLVSAIVEMM